MHKEKGEQKAKRKRQVRSDGFILEDMPSSLPPNFPFFLFFIRLLLSLSMPLRLQWTLLASSVRAPRTAPSSPVDSVDTHAPHDDEFADGDFSFLRQRYDFPRACMHLF